MPPQAVIFDIGKVLIEWAPVDFYDRTIGPQRRRALIFTDDRPENIQTARNRGWQTSLFDGSQGWADRLVAEGLLSEKDAA